MRLCDVRQQGGEDYSIAATTSKLILDAWKKFDPPGDFLCIPRVPKNVTCGVMGIMMRDADVCRARCRVTARCNHGSWGAVWAPSWHQSCNGADYHGTVVACPVREAGGAENRTIAIRRELTARLPTRCHGRHGTSSRGWLQ